MRIFFTIVVLLSGASLHAETLLDTLRLPLATSYDCQKILRRYSDSLKMPELIDFATGKPLDVAPFQWSTSLIADENNQVQNEPSLIEKRVSSRVIPGDETSATPLATAVSFTAFVKPSADQPSPRVKIDYSAKRKSDYLREQSNQALVEEMRSLLKGWYERAVSETGDSAAPPEDVFLGVMTKVQVVDSGKSKRIMFTINSRSTTNFIIRIYQILLADLGLLPRTFEGESWVRLGRNSGSPN